MLTDEDATVQLARTIAPHLQAGDTLGLTGGLGVGKSLFARALISERLAAIDSVEDIPSPSFTLVQTYDLGSVELWHADLYRLGDMNEISELGLEDAFSTAICVVEWADRLASRGAQGSWPRRALMLDLEFASGGPGVRHAHLAARGEGWDWLPNVLDTAKVQVA